MKTRLLHTFLTFAFPALFIISCSKSSGGLTTSVTPPPGGGTTPTTCDTVDMKYGADIVPILQSRCYGCHGGGSTLGSGGISLDSYNNLKIYADNGFLKGNITHAPGFVGMPFGQPKMDDCTINKILDWINRGTKNN